MLSILNAAFSLIIALVICFSRPVTVFTAFQPGLWFFHQYRMKRTFGITLAFVLGISALLMEHGGLANTLVFTAGIFTLIAIFLNPDQIFPALNMVESIPAIKVSEKVLSEAFFGDDREVIVVEVNQERRAYPLGKMVAARHLVHDVVGGVPVLVSYCPLCGSGVAFQAELNAQERFFSVVGVFRRNLIMEDHVTHTIWQQATGKAIYGKDAGCELAMLPAFQLSWQEAKKLGRITLAMEPEDVRKGPFSRRKAVEFLGKITGSIMVPGFTPLTKALDPRETVFGIHLNGASKAYPLSRLTQLKEFTDEIGGTAIELSFDPEKNLLLAKRMNGDVELLVERHWWLGWKEFHPETELYQ